MQQVQEHGAQICDDRQLGAGAPICRIWKAKRQEMHARQEELKAVKLMLLLG